MRISDWSSDVCSSDLPGDCPERGARGCGHARQPMAGRREPTRDMLRIQLAHSYFLSFDQKQWERGKPYPPLATIQVAAMLRQMGHHVTLFDDMLAEGTDAYAATLRDSRRDEVRSEEHTAELQ